MENTLFSRNMVMIILGQVVSLLGNAILRFALPLYILETSGSPALFGFVSAAAFLPMIALSLLGGVMADRLNKQRIMVALDFAAAAIVGIFMVMYGQFSLVPLVIGALLLLYGIQGAYQPAVQASLPLLVSGKNLVSANAMVNLVSSLSGLLGPVIGGILYTGYGLWPILSVSAVCFALSAIMELFIRIPHTKRSFSGNVFGMIHGDMKDGLRFIFRENPLVGKVIGIVFCIGLFMSSLISIGLPVIITQTLGLDGLHFGYAEAVMALGGIVGGLLAGIAGRRMEIGKTWRLMVACALCMAPIGLALFFQMSTGISYAVLLVSFFLMMAIAMILNILLLAYLQANTPRDIVGKVISCAMALSMCAQPLGQAMYGYLFERFAHMPWMLFLLGAVITGIISLLSKGAMEKLSDATMAEGKDAVRSAA